MAKTLHIIGMIVGGLGLFLGFFYLSGNPLASVRIVTVTTVGIVGLLAFVRHVLFHRSDATRLGWETDRPDWMFEVGFANLAFGFMGFLTVLSGWGPMPAVVVVLGYALYLLQAGILHGYRYFTDKEKSLARLWRSCLATILYAGMMTCLVLLAVARLQT